MIIEILKKSVERFWQTADFGPALPDGVKIQTCAVTGANNVIDGKVWTYGRSWAVRLA